MSAYVTIESEGTSVTVCVSQEGAQGAPGTANKEIILFAGLQSLVIPWNSTRLNRFGASGHFYVEIIGDDGQARWTYVEIIPDSIVTTTQYIINFGGPQSGRITIS